MESRHLGGGRDALHRGHSALSSLRLVGRAPRAPMWQGHPGLAWWGEPSSASPYGNSTVTLKNLSDAFSAAVASSTAFHSPSSLSAPFSTARISAPVQRFVFGSHSTFGLSLSVIVTVSGWQGGPRSPQPCPLKVFAPF